MILIKYDQSEIDSKIIFSKDCIEQMYMQMQKNGYPVYRDKDKNICIKGSVRSGLAEIKPIACSGFTTPKLNISDLEILANKVSVNPFDITREKITNSLEQSCKNYIKENNISLDDWKNILLWMFLMMMIKRIHFLILLDSSNIKMK